MDEDEQLKARRDAGRKLHAFRSLIAYMSGMIAGNEALSAYFQYKMNHPEDIGEGAPEQETKPKPNNNNDERRNSN